jgi:hypothetical protein
MGAPFKYILGTTIPSMSTQAGINARKFGFVVGSLRGFNRKIAQIKGYTEAGLYMAAAHLRRETEETEPITPVGKTGHLRESWRVTRAIASTPENPAVEAGYTADYAVYVHEMTEPPYEEVNWSRLHSGPKWFEKAFRRSEKEMIRIIADNAKLGTI